MTCSLCRLDAPGETVNAGGDLGDVHRDCFVEYDRRAEAEEALGFAAPELDLQSMLVLGTSPRYEKRVANRVGERVGENTVVALEYRRRANGSVRRCWRMRCACGREHLVESHRLDRQGARSCTVCKDQASAERERTRAVHVAGFTIAEIAEAAGVPHQTIRQRIRLGWPVERLSEPARRRAA